MGENDQGQVEVTADKTGIKVSIGMEGHGIHNKAKDVCVKKEETNAFGRKKKKKKGWSIGNKRKDFLPPLKSK